MRSVFLFFHWYLKDRKPTKKAILDANFIFVGLVVDVTYILLKLSQ